MPPDPAAPIDLPAEKVFLREGPRARTIGELRRSAAAVAGRLAGELPSDGGPFPPVAVYVRSPFDLAAGILGAWKARALPILVDPSSRREIEALAGELPGVRFLADDDLLPPGRGIPLPPPAGDEPIRPPGPEEPIVAFFTSGSEGRPKLIRKVGRQVYAHARAVARMLGLPPAPRALSYAPLYHILGFSYGFMVPLLAGGETSLVTGESPAAMLEALVGLQPDLVVATAVHYRFLDAVLPPGGAEIPDAVYISSGAPLHPRDREEFEAKTGRKITELYGSTETAGIARRIGDEPWMPYPGVRFRIDGDRLLVRSPWADPDDPDRWVPTHDAVEPDGEGFRLRGRASGIAKVGGKRFSTLEVEACLRTCPGVDDAAAVLYERDGEPALAAFVVLAAGGPSLAEVRSFLAARLAPFKVPRTLEALPALPRGKLEKLDYAELRRLAGNG